MGRRWRAAAENAQAVSARPTPGVTWPHQPAGPNLELGQSVTFDVLAPPPCCGDETLLLVPSISTSRSRETT